VRAPCAGVAVAISVSETVLDDCILFVSHKVVVMNNSSYCLPLCNHVARAGMEQTGNRSAAGCGNERTLGNQAIRGGLLGDNSGDSTGSSSSSSGTAARPVAIGRHQPSTGRGDDNSGSVMETKAKVCMSVTLLC
jgi:hypothetical protein